jgi:CheY-like chemotaxis protein
MVTNWLTSSLPIAPYFGDPKGVPFAADKPQQARKRIEGGRKIKVVVVDDESVIAETVVEILNQEGFEAIAAANGPAAIELAQTYVPDVVLSDVAMPGLTGIEIGVKIREIVPDCRIILFSGQAATVDMLQEARERGHSFDILAKPIKPEQLISVICSGFDFV